MAFYIGDIDPLKLIEELLNQLVANGALTGEQAKRIVENSKVKKK